MTCQSDDYAAFVQGKVATAQPCGFDPATLAGPLFPHQRALTEWAVRRGRAAIFAATGLGKTRCYLAWADAVARHTGGEVLVLTPLAVAPQGAAEARAMGLDARVARDGSEVAAPITITNYDRLHRFDPSRFVGVVLDESSCIKHHDTKTLRVLLDSFARAPYRLACTATPAPNDWTELGTHAEFLGVCSRTEMLAEFFVHDGGSTQDWRLKGHARDAFWRWVSSWGALVRSPADLGYDASGYDLPPLSVEQHTLASDHVSERAAGMLFAMPAQSLSERRSARRGSIDARVAACAARVNADAEPWVVWCDLNDESDALVRAIPGAVEVRGADSTEWKENAAAWFCGLYSEECECPGSQSTQRTDAQSPTPTPSTEQSETLRAPRKIRSPDSNTTASGPSETASAFALTASGSPTNGTPSAERPTRPSPSGATKSSPKSGRGQKRTPRSYERSDSASTDSLSSNTPPSCESREAFAQSAGAPNRSTAIPGPGNSDDSTSITATLPARSEDCSALLATWDSGSLATTPSGSTAPPCTCGKLTERRRKVLVSKTSIFGFGLNFQHCARTAFVGVTDSWEAYHQAVRRFYRFGQTRPVQVHVYSSELEGSVVANLARKERDATALADALSAETLASVQAAVLGSRRDVNPYEPKAPLRVPAWLRTRSEAS